MRNCGCVAFYRVYPADAIIFRSFVFAYGVFGLAAANSPLSVENAHLSTKEVSNKIMYILSHIFRTGIAIKRGELRERSDDCGSICACAREESLRKGI